jgi:tetratricopeptide (TPR) repeat protein
VALLKRLFRSSGAAVTEDRRRATRESPASDGSAASPSVVVVAAAAAAASAGRYADALGRVSDALDNTPDDVELVFAKGSILFEWGRHWEARKVLLQAEALGLRDKALYERLGWTCMWTTGAASAEGWMRMAVAADDASWLGHFGLATAARLLGKIDDAVAGFERALARAPANVNCLVNLAECKTAQNQLDCAEAYARRAVDADGGSVLGWTNLGIVLIAQYRFAEAADAFARAERLDAAAGGESDQGLNLGNCLRDMGDAEGAVEFYAVRLAQRPSASGHAHYAYALLTAGRFAEGWSQYEFRWLQQPLLARRPSFRKPVWDGQDLRGKTILLRTEQGIGDAIQFIRYAPHVKALGATVLLQVRPGVGELARGFPGVDRILDPADAYPEFDFYIHLMSLPRVFGTELASVPNDVPYLKVDPTRRARWAARFRDVADLKVGLVWAGDPGHLRDRYRSVALSALRPLADVAGVQFYSLQKGPAAMQLGDNAAGMRIVDLGPELLDFADTAAVLDQLDLLIGVDTSVAHLAGALGKPAWVLIPSPADWRWMNKREDSPWYPTMRLFRQRVQGDWSDVYERVKDALETQARSHRSAHEVASSGWARSASRPMLRPIAGPRRPPPGMSAVAETRVGIVQYFPEEPIVGESIGLFGEYQQLQIDVLAPMVKAGAVVLEIGSGVGLHALALASRVREAGHLFVAEARLLYRRLLRQNLGANGVGNVTVLKRVDADDTIDDLRLEKLDWIKLSDASDALATLGGAEQTLWRLRPSLFIAVPDDRAFADASTRARDFAYRCWRVDTPYYNRQNFNLRDADTFSASAAVALLAVPEEREFAIAVDHCTEVTEHHLRR